MTPFAKKLADIALKQWESYHLLREQEPKLAKQIEQYWTGIGNFTSVQVHWSAVFVSWCVRQAGATSSEFRFAEAHANFVYKAIQNQQNNQGVFRGRRVAEYAPKVGDILHNNRAGNNFNYDFAAQNHQYESHSAIIIEVGVDSKGRYLRTVGGNENDSVGLKEVRLNQNSIIKNTTGLYISIIQCLK
jgi:hypothetical protein